VTVECGGGEDGNNLFGDVGKHEEEISWSYAVPACLPPAMCVRCETIEHSQLVDKDVAAVDHRLTGAAVRARRAHA